jgi:hypothetical protein
VMATDATRNEDEGSTLPQLLRRAIAARGVTLAWLHERLTAHGNPVSMATLSYWRSGARRPEGAQSLAALSSIEDLLHLPSGALTRHLGPSARIGPVGAPRFPLMQETSIEEAVIEAFAALDSPLPETSRDVSTHSVTQVGADGTMISRTTRSLIQATIGEVTTVPYLELSPGVPTPAPIFRAVGGAHVSKLYSHPSGEVHGALFVLERPIGLAQTALIEWTMELPPDYPPAMETGHGVSRQSRELLLWTRFHPDALPDWIEEMVESPSGVVQTPLSLDGGTSIHQVRRRFGPGMLILRWGYGDRD